jgi:hypothetical protein
MIRQSTRFRKVALFSAVACMTAFAASDLFAAPLVTVSLSARLQGSGDPFSNSLTAVTAGQTYDYQIQFLLAPVGTSNTQGVTTRTINSWNVSDGSNSTSNGLNNIKYSIYQNTSQQIQVNVGLPSVNSNFTAGSPAAPTLVDRDGAGPGTNFDAINGFASAATGTFWGISSANTPGLYTLATGTFTVSSIGSGASSVLNVGLQGATGTFMAGLKYNGSTTFNPTAAQQAGGDPPIAFSGLTLLSPPTTTATDFTLTASAGSTNVLLGGNTGITSTIANVGTGTDDTLNFTGLNASSGAGGTVTGAGSNGGPLAQSASANNTGLTFTGTAYGTSTVTPTVATATNATLGGNATNTGTTTVNINVGNATADTDGGFTAGNALTAATGSNLAGLASKVVSGSSVAIQSEAIILEANTVAANAQVSMNWRDRTAAEQQNGNPIFANPQVNLGSDVVDLTGVIAGATTLYTLQMNYDDTGLVNEAQAAAEGFIFLGHLDAGTWVNAGDLGLFGAPDLDGYQAGTDFVLGKWGVNTATNTVWAVVDHSSEFAAVVPEPASLGVLALGGLALLGRRRK